MKLKKVISAALILTLVTGLFTGCGQGNTAKEEEEKTRIIVDQVGNEVELPEKIERVIIASVWPLASVYVLSLIHI